MRKARKNIEVVTTFPDSTFLEQNDPDAPFTGLVYVENWNGKLLKSYLYKDDRIALYDPKQKKSKDRLIYCENIIDYYTCVETGTQVHSCRYQETEITFSPCDDGGSEYYVLYGYSPSTGSSGDGGSGSDNDPNDDDMPEVCDEGYVSDGKGGCVLQTSQSLQDIMRCEELSDSQLMQLDEVINEYLNAEYIATCLNIQIFDYVVNNDMTLCFKMGTVTESPGEYHSSSSSIHFKNTENIKEHVFGEEFFHVYQELYYGGLPSNFGRSNIEFNAKLFHDLSHNGACCIAFWDEVVQDQYLEWLVGITDYHTKMPSWDEMSDKYYYFLEKFTELKPEYDYPIDYSHKPDAIFNLNDCL